MSGRPELREDMRKGWCPGALRPMAARDGLLVRLRITGGIVPAALARAIAGLAERHGNGLLDLSARANLQLRGVREDALPVLLDGLGALGLVDEHAGAEAVRNVLASPLAGLGRRRLPRSGGEKPREARWRGLPPPPSPAGIDPAAASIEARQPPPSPSVPLPHFAEEDRPDIRPLVAALERALVADPALHALPAKFGFLVDDGGAPSLAGIAADIRFDWVAAQRAFSVGLGGPAAAALGGGLAAPDELVGRAIALAHRLLARPGEPRRIGALVREIGCEATAAWFGARLPASVQAGTHPQVVGPHGFDGVSTFGLAAPFGRLDAAMLRAAAHSSAGELRLTPWRTILLPGVTAADAPGFIADPVDPRLRVVACTGQAGCERGSTDTRADATTLAGLAAALPGNGIALHVSGCSKGCARPRRTALTLVGCSGRYDLLRDGRPGDEPMLKGLDLAGIRGVLAGFGARL